jgi:hypothetical protein
MTLRSTNIEDSSGTTLRIDRANEWISLESYDDETRQAVTLWLRDDEVRWLAAELLEMTGLGPGDLEDCDE